MGKIRKRLDPTGSLAERLPAPKLAALFAITAIVAYGLLPHHAIGENHLASAELRAAVNELDQWLGAGPNARRWRRFLRLNRLRQQLANGGAADPAVLEAVLARFDRPEAGLEMPQFQAVRDAASKWHDELVAEAKSDIPARLAAAIEQFTPVTPEDVATARADLLEATARLEAYLDTGGENGEAWKRFLLWSDLQDQLAEGATVNRSALESSYHRLSAGYPGLELPVFSETRTALLNYVERVWAAGDEEQRDLFSRRLDLLARAIQATAADPASDQRSILGRVLGVLERRGQNRLLVNFIRHRFSKPNLFVRISDDFLSAGMIEPIDESQPVTDSILGASISGTGRTRGNVRIALVPSTDGARFEAVFEGAVETRTVGRKGPSRFGSRGVTQIVGRHRLRFDDKGIAAATTVSDARTKTTTTGIWSTRCGPIDRIVRGVTRRRISRDKSLGERIAADHAEERFNQGMDLRIAELVQDGNQTFWSKYRDPLQRRGEFPRLMRFHTGAESLHLTILQANGLQLAAPGNPPPLEGDSDIAVQIHESMLNNLAAALLSGETLDEQTFLEDVEQMFGSLPAFLEPDPDSQPWIITFQSRRPPVVVDFQDGTIRISIRGRRFASGDRDIRSEFDITAEYRLVKSETALTAIRIGDPEVFPSDFVQGRDTLSLREQSRREILERKFRDTFRPEIVFDLETLPGPWEGSGQLAPVQVLCDDGWLVLSWRLVPAAAQPVADAKPREASHSVAARK